MAKTKKLKFQDWLQSVLIRLCRIHFSLIAVYVVYVVASDATMLVTASATYDRWSAIALLATVNTLVWYFARAPKKSANYYRLLAYALIVTDIALATFSVYSTRGMASRAVMLYSIAIVSSAILLSRVAILATATLSAASYGMAAIKYFTDYFNEGYKAELYIEVGLYIAIFYILAAILGVIIRFNKPETELGL
jgi:hypothetical protein